MFDRRFFIIGNPRSGTTLLRLLLTTHPFVIVPPECGFIAWLHEKYGRWTSLDSNNDTTINEFVRDLSVTKKFETWDLESALIQEEIRKNKPRCYADLCDVIGLAYNNRLFESAKIIGDKNNFYIDYLEVLNKIYPDSLYIQIVRDGRDIVCSYREVMSKKSSSVHAPNLHTDVESIAREWLKNTQIPINFLEKIDNARHLTIRYEDLVSKPVVTLEQVCEFLGIDYEQKMLEFHRNNRLENLEPMATLDWKMRTLSPISSDTVGRYKKILSEMEILLFQNVAGRSLISYDYEIIGQ